MKCNPDSIHSFLLIGQSNMVGRGFYHEAVPVDKSHTMIFEDGAWTPLVYPADPDEKKKGVCLSESFAECYTNDFHVNVGLICCAEGGTNIDQWCVGGALFERACNMAELASQTSTIAGILWHQGESDCQHERYPEYEKKLTAVLDTLRKRLNLGNVPLIVGELGDFLGMNSLSYYQNYIYINEAIRNYAAKTALTACVSSQGLVHNNDYLHFNSHSLYELGLRYYKAYLSVRNQ